MAINLQAIQEDKRQRELAAMTPEPEEKGLLDSLYDSIVRASDYVDGPELKEEGYSEIVEPATSLYLKTIDNEIKAANNYQQAVDNWESNDAVDYARGNLMASPFKEAGREFINAYADDSKNSPFFSAGANDLMQSNIGYNYIMNDEDKLSRARKIEQEIGIPSGTVLYDKEAWTNANKLYENIQKQKDFFSENGKEMSLEDVQKLNPILTRISTSDPAAGALIMADMGNIKKQMDIFDTFDEYLEVGKLKLELDNLGEKYRKNEQTFDDMYRMQELQDKINRFYDKHDNNFFDSPLNFAVAGLASSWPEMQGSIEEGLKEQAAWTIAGISAGGIAGSAIPVPVVGTAGGAAVGGIGGIVTGLLRNLPRLAKVGGIILKNMTPGKYTGFKLGSFGGMAAPETGSRYLEYRDMKDKDGNQVMTRDEASDRAVIGGTVNAFLETFPTFGAMERMAKGNKAGKEVVDLIFRGAQKKYTEPIAKTAAAEFALNTLKGAAVESGEESLQTAADDLMLNDIEKTHPGTIEGGIKSYKDIATDALGAFVMSYPTSLLFGAAEGLGAGAFSTSRYAAQHKQIRAQEQIFGEQVQNTAIGNALVSELQDAVQNSKLKDTAPDVQQQIIKEKAAGTGYEIVYIDTEMAMEKESGRKDLEAVAKAANISSEELETAIEEKGTLAVPLECFAQADSSPELLESASYKTEAQSIARMKKEAIETIQRLKEADQKHLGQLKNMVDVVAEEYFPADENDKQGKARQDMCKAIIMTFAENPAMGWNEMMKMVQSERMELLQPALDFINETSGKGTVVIPTEDGKGFRATNNFHWYSKWAKEHNYRAMTKADKEELAEEMVRGNAQIGDFRGPAEAFAESGRKLDEINGKIKALDEIKDKMKELNGVEMRLTEGLTKEGFSVYRAVYDQLKEAKGYASRSARAGAIIYARRADLYAKIMREKGQTNYTAKDFMERNIIQFGGQTPDGVHFTQEQVASAEAKLKEDTYDWSKQIDSLFKGDDVGKEIQMLSQTPLVMQLLNNVPNYPIYMGRDKIKDIHKKHPGMTKDILKKIPEALTNPMMIFKSATQPGRIVVALELKDKNGVEIVVPFELSVDNKKHISVSAYGRILQDDIKTVDMQWYIDNINHGNTLYINRKKADKFFSLARVQFPLRSEKKFINFFGNSIYTEKDLVNAKNQNPTMYQLGAAAKNQMAEIRKQYEGTDQWMKAPNGKDTNLSEEQWLAVRTPAFKEWFGDWENDPENASKIVDENGEPMVVYHGTPLGGFTEFKRELNYFTADKEYADRYQDPGASSDYVKGVHEKLGDAMTYSVFLNIRKPFDTRNAKEKEIFENEFYRQWGNGAPLSEKGLPDWTDSDDFKEFFEENEYEYDGLLLDEGGIPGEDGNVKSRGISYVAFESNQIKSATDNNGNYDANNPNVYYQVDGGEKIKKQMYGYPQNYDSNTQPVEKFYQSAWHGSPYDFDEFDLGAIGNGQGGAVHGWGLYFANKKQVSEKYRKSVIAYKNKETGEMLPTDITNAALEIEERYGHEKAIEVIQKGINNDPDATNISAKQQMLEFLANKDIYERTKGRLYKVDIPNNKDLIQEENNYLNQTKAIRQKMAEAVNGLNDTQKASFVEKLQHYFMKDVEPSADAEVVISQAVALEKGLKAIQKYHSSKMQKVQERAMERGLISKSAIERVKKSPEEAAKVAKEYEAILKETQKLAETAQKTEGVKQAKFKQTQQDKLESYKKEPSKLLEAENVISGKEFYKGITAAFGNDKQASLYLNEHGIKGITWNDEGGQFVIFDDKAISIIEKFNQGIKGSITPMSNGKRIINIFEAADESTFLHEMGHLFLLDLEELAQIDEKSAQELATVTEWATYKKEDVKGYKGTPFESEFLKLAANIEAAEKNGDIATAEQLKRKWMHERFARAFEMYLEFGQAPSTGLKSVFRKFKQFLIHIYIGFTGEGVRATPEVERVMARMIASDAEIEAAALSDRYKDITKAGGEKLLTETESETMARWHEEAKAEAKEKLLAIIMKDLKEEKAREYQAKLDKEREDVTRFIESQPVYIAQKVLSENGGSKEDVVAMGIYGSIEQLEADLDAVKDILPDRAIEDRMADYAKELDQQMIDEQITEEKISEIMNRTYYHNKLLALETAALEDRTRSLQRISSKTKNAIDEANIALDGIEDNTNIKKAKYSDGVKKLLKALSKLRVSKQWNGEELQAIDKIINSTTKEEASDALKEFVNRQGEWKRNLKNVQEAFDGRMKLMDKMAREELAKKSLADACNYGKYVRMEKQASQMMNKFIRLGKWEAALRQQEIRLQAAAMAKYAKKNQEQLKKLTDRVKKQLTAKTVKLPKDERYWHRRMAYLLNLAKENPTEPVDGVVPLREIFKGLNDSLDIQEMDFTDIYKTITRDGFGGYMTLTMAELEDAVNMLTVLYTTGRDKFRVKSFDGMNLSDVVDEICEDETGIGIMTQNRFINPDQGGVGYNDLLANIPHIGEVLSRAGQKYITSMVKPELLLKLIGNKAYKYIYGLYERAANQEGKMSAESIRKLQEILSVYSHDEKRDWKTKKYTFETGAGVEKLSKENIICMALNRGNETNWNRLAKGMRVQFEDLAKFIDEHMTAKDWQTVQAIWDYLDSYWEDTTRVEEKLNGITMKKVQRRPFWVKPKGNDKYIKLEGGYYPIAYNPEKSAKAEAQSVDAAAQRTMSGAQVLGTGRGFTKARNESMNISRPLKLSFDVITEHTSNVIHNITWRLACRDVYRLTHSTKFEELIRNTLGAEALRSINEWVVDCWKTMPGATDQATGTINKLFGWLRRNAGFNIMGYRMWPAVENVTNIFPMMDQLGAADTMAAIGDYYAHKTENDRLILRSSFMTNRINNMDRDIKNIPGLFDESMRGLGWMKQHAYSMLAYTDLMLSAPLWCRAYKNSIAQHYMEVEKENKEQVAAFKAAQDRVHELNTAMYDLKREKEKILLKLHPEYEEEYTPMRAKEIGYLNSELNRINKELAPMEKARWQAELELDKLANVDLMLPDDILKEAEERAVHSADAAVRNVFGSGHIKDLAPIQKGGEFAKMLTCFYSFFNTQANAILAAYYQGKFAKADISGLQNISVWMPMAKSILFRIFLTSALTTVLKMALLGDGSDDKDKYRKIKLEDGTEVKEEIPQLERFLTEYAKNTISTASGTLWGIRDIAGAITNYIFEGNDFGGARFASVPSIAIEKSIKTFEMAMQKGERDARIEADEERRKARYDKMTPKQKKKFDEELQYRHPPKRITWADIWKMGVGAITSVTAAETGITDTVANTVMTTLQYMADGDGRYDPSIENIFWSAFWNKKPVERAIPEKPVQPKNNKKKKGA